MFNKKVTSNLPQFFPIGKKGEERIFTIWWFIIVMAVSAVIVLATLGFFSKEADTKGYEAGILYERIMECLVQNGYLRSDFSETFEVYGECNLNKEVIENTSSFYIGIYLDDKLVLERGDKSKRTGCSLLQEDTKSKAEIGCVVVNEPVLYSTGDIISKAKIGIVVISSQESESYNLGVKNE